MASGRVEVIDSKGCLRAFTGFAASMNLRSVGLMSPASTALLEADASVASGPFSGLVICVTGLSKEARNQVMAATERLGGQYSSTLHPQYIYLLERWMQSGNHLLWALNTSYSFGGRKFEHALRHGSRNGLLIVTLGWFVDSVRRNVRLSESLYSVKSAGQCALPVERFNQLAGLPGTEKSCLPEMAFDSDKSSKTCWQPHLQSSRKELKSASSVFSEDLIYVDSNISSELKNKVIDVSSREGARFLDHWFSGCHASYVVCEGASIQRYIGHTNRLVTPLWILNSAKEKCLQRLVHLSSDLAKQVAILLENAQDTNGDSVYSLSLNSRKAFVPRENTESFEERQKLVELAKLDARNRRRRRMQTPLHPITPTNLLDSICWSISEPPSSACIYIDASGVEDANDLQTSVFFDARDGGRGSDVLFDNFSRPLKDSEKREVIFKNHFLTILFPVDRFGELGPSSRTFFSSGGFSCLEVLDHIYSFYQENMSAGEINVAIHTDSRYADHLRSLYASKESIEQGFVPFKRIDFLGSRRSFEALKRVSGENNRNVYELLIRA